MADDWDDSDDLFARSRRSDPWTSHMAGVEIDLSPLFADIYRTLLTERIRGMANFEIVAATGIMWNTCTPRMIQLVEKGWVCRKVDPDRPRQENGKPNWLTRLNPKTNKPQIIWWPIVKEHDIEAVQASTNPPEHGAMAASPDGYTDSERVRRIYKLRT